MKIAVIPSWHSDTKNPVAGIYMLQQAKDLSKIHEVEYLIFSNSILSSQHIYNSDKLTIVEFSTFYLPRKNLAFLSKWADKFCKFFHSRITSKPYDVIHAHDHIAGYAAYKMYIKFGIPYVVTIHNTSFINGSIEKWRKEYLTKMFDSASAVIAVGKTLMLHLKNEYNVKNVIHIPNYIDHDDYRLKYENTVNDDIRFISTGACNVQKGFDILIKACRIIQTVHPELGFKLTLIGDGTLRKKFHRLIKNLGLQKNIELKGWVTPQEIPEILAKSDVYICASRVETFGIAVLEALASGLPVITTRCGGPEDLIDTYSGLTINPESPESLAEAMVYMHFNHKKFIPSHIKSGACLQYDKKVILPQIINQLKKAYEASHSGLRK